jgi:hypothetical protein
VTSTPREPNFGAKYVPLDVSTANAVEVSYETGKRERARVSMEASEALGVVVGVLMPLSSARVIQKSSLFVRESHYRRMAAASASASSGLGIG